MNLFRSWREFTHSENPHYDYKYRRDSRARLTVPARSFVCTSVVYATLYRRKLFSIYPRQLVQSNWPTSLKPERGINFAGLSLLSFLKHFIDISLGHAHVTDHCVTNFTIFHANSNRNATKLYFFVSIKLPSQTFLPRNELVTFTPVLGSGQPHDFYSRSDNHP